MFDKCLLERTGRVRTGWSMMASMLVQISLVGAGLIAPLFNPELIPRAAAAWGVRIAPPPGRPAPPPADVQRASKPRSRQAPSRTFAALVEPNRIRPVAILVDDPAPTVTNSGFDGPYVPFGDPQHSGVSPLGRALVAAPPPPPPALQKKEPVAAKPAQVRMGGDVAEAKLVHKVIPAYPVLARQTRTQGTVVFTAVISAEGTITQLHTVSGSPLLTPAAAEAVRQWRYRPTLLNGQPVEVLTTIEVTFTLKQ